MTRRHSLFRWFTRAFRTTSKTRFVIGMTAALITAALILFVADSPMRDRIATSSEIGDRERDEVPPALAKKMAAWSKASPGSSDPRSDNPLEGPTGWAEQDWLMHSIDGAENSPPAFTA